MPRRKAATAVSESEDEKQVEVEDEQIEVESEPTPTRIIADLYPAGLRPWPQEIPHTRIRVVLTDTHLTVLWEGYGGDHPLCRVDYLLPDGPGPMVTAQGGDLPTGQAVWRASGCQCGPREVRQAVPWPGL